MPDATILPPSDGFTTACRLHAVMMKLGAALPSGRFAVFVVHDAEPPTADNRAPLGQRGTIVDWAEDGRRVFVDGEGGTDLYDLTALAPDPEDPPAMLAALWAIARARSGLLIVDATSQDWQIQAKLEGGTVGAWACGVLYEPAETVAALCVAAGLALVL